MWQQLNIDKRNQHRYLQVCSILSIATVCFETNKASSICSQLMCLQLMWRQHQAHYLLVPSHGIDRSTDQPQPAIFVNVHTIWMNHIFLCRCVMITTFELSCFRYLWYLTFATPHYVHVTGCELKTSSRRGSRRRLQWRCRCTRNSVASSTLTSSWKLLGKPVRKLVSKHYSKRSYFILPE